MWNSPFKEALQLQTSARGFNRFLCDVAMTSSFLSSGYKFTAEELEQWSCCLFLEKIHWRVLLGLAPPLNMYDKSRLHELRPFTLWRHHFNATRNYLSMAGAQAQSMSPTCSGKRTDLCKDLKELELPHVKFVPPITGSDGVWCIAHRCLGDYRLLEHNDHGGFFLANKKGVDDRQHSNTYERWDSILT